MSEETADNSQQDNQDPSNPQNDDEEKKPSGDEEGKGTTEGKEEGTGDEEEGGEEKSKVDPKDFEPESRFQQPDGGSKEDNDSESGDEDGDVNPDDKKTISKIVSEQTAPLTAQQRLLQDQLDVDSFIRQNPEYDKYREVAIKHLQHRSYSDVPVKNIMAMVSANDAQRLGAEKERIAAKKARETQVGGTSNRASDSGGIDWNNATAEQIEEQKAKMRDQSRQ